MKKKIYLLILISLNFYGQNLLLKINGTSATFNKKIDSIGYFSKHSTAKAMLGEVNSFSERVLKLGYLASKVTLNQHLNDSVFEYECDFGQPTELLHICILKKNQYLLGLKEDTVFLKFNESETFIKNVLNKLESKGFSMAKVKLTNLKSAKNFITTLLTIDLDKKRQLNDIIVNGYDKFPQGHLKNLKRLYKKKVFNTQNLEQLQKKVSQFRFVKQLKYPEILFTQDSTKIFVYVEKTNNNTFDGLLGFTNDDKKKLIFSGYVDLVLNNILNSGEKLAINWRSNGSEQTTFNATVEIPYIFNSPIGTKGNLNIIKQDSTFQTTQTAIDLGYYFNYSTRLYVGYQSSESSNIKNLNTASISDYTNEFVTSNFEFTNYQEGTFLFPEKTSAMLKIGIGKRSSKLQDNSQFYGNLNLKHDFYVNEKNCINIKSQNFYLQSGTYLINELHRFGGINSIRGFNENSLQGSLFISLLTEYRYIATSNLYIHTIFDYGFYEDKTANKSDKLLGIGFGFGLLTKNGLFNLVYANGSTQKQEFKLSNSIVQISLKAIF